jgi:hypothetical protein
MQLRDYQERNVDEAVGFLKTAVPGRRRLYCASCGTGKSLIEIEVQRRMGEGCWILTPRLEIIDQMIEKGGNPGRICTPTVLRNRLLEGRVAAPEFLICDEAHHDTSNTANDIRLCCAEPPAVAYTATPFRGTPQGTAALRALYGPPHWIITLRQAAERGFLTIPECKTVPVLDDEIVEIKNGELSVKSIERKTVWSTATDLVCGVWGSARGVSPSVVSLPTVWACRELCEQLAQRGIRSRVVTADTPAADRRVAFDECVAAQSVLLQVQVVSEGVDLPIRCLIDLAPTLSPVRWLQQIGRIMRPGGASVYVCANRNLLRHGYLLEGLVPSEAFAQSQAVFPAPSKRIGIRAFGLEGVGRLKPAPVPLANGLTGHAYYVSRAGGYNRSEQYCCIVLPHTPEPLWAVKQKSWEWEGGQCQVDYGKWTRCSAPSELTGFASVPPKPLTERQAAKWKQLAKHTGLDPGAEVDSKSCQALFVLLDTQMRIS